MVIFYVESRHVKLLFIVDWQRVDGKVVVCRHPSSTSCISCLVFYVVIELEYSPIPLY